MNTLMQIGVVVLFLVSITSLFIFFCEGKKTVYTVPITEKRGTQNTTLGGGAPFGGGEAPSCSACLSQCITELDAHVAHYRAMQALIVTEKIRNGG